VPADFSRLVSLACHDLRTPLATVQGFAKTLLRVDTEVEQRERYLGMIDAASAELVELTDRLALAARIEGRRYEPVVREADSLELARAAVANADGHGAPVRVDVEAVERALRDLVRAVARHGGVEPTMQVDGPRVGIRPLTADTAPVVLGDEPRDLGASVAVQVVRALGGDVGRAGDALWIDLPG
jgi:signal transduction histidine kinase